MRLLLWIPLLLCSIGSAWSMAIKLTAAEYPPYCSQKLEGSGIVIDLLRSALDAQGHTLVVDFKPWSRAYKEAQFGLAHGILCLWRSREREHWFYYPKPFLLNKIGFYAHRDKIPAHLDYQKLLIGNVRGYLLPQSLQDMDLNISMVKDDSKLLDMLIRKRIDLAVIEYSVAQYLIRQHHPSEVRQIVWYPPPLEEKFLYVGISRKHPEAEQVFRIVNESLTKLHASERWQQILSSYAELLPPTSRQ
ncbi:substrate-binding periplasmic protein [Dongshaea marina]|uniref:substrate-binding periplasmic protein n=1 Tax=Dongshaea marina TaxID=2047966 RepID=UPI000D3EA5E5|nr:transporter substrate-binding domain-containing protein [Dongshaea marina]